MAEFQFRVKSSAPPPEPSAANRLNKKLRYRSQLLSDKNRSKTRVNIGPTFARWSALKELLRLKSHAQMATLLLDRYDQSGPSTSTPGKLKKKRRLTPDPAMSSVFVSLSPDRKRSPSVHPQDEERRTPALKDDVWVNLSCLLQLFQECGRCRGVCTINPQEDKSHFSVVQYCKACNHWVIWNSQPLKSTSTENGEKKEDVQVPVSLPCDDRQGRQKVTTGSETETGSEMEAWNEEHIVELEVNIDSDFSDELPLCRLEEKGEEEELGLQLDEMHEENVRQTEKHHKDVEETEKQIAESVGSTVEVKGENDQGIDEASEDDEWQREEEDEDWSEEEEQQEEASQTSDPDFEISKSIQRRSSKMKICENESKGIDKVTEDKEWQMNDDEDEDDEEEEQKKHLWESDPSFKKIKLIKSRHRMRQVFVRRYPQRLCPNCGVMYASQSHMCNDRRKFPCPKCGRLWVSELNVNAHIVHCNGSMFPCRFCLKPFGTQVDKLNHERSHEATDKPFSCSKCPETFADFHKRNRHLKVHRVLTCQTCHKSFSMLHRLRRHEQSHLDDKPFKCQVCERAFAQGSQLKCHMRVHTGERPYKCQLCPMRFNHNVSLKTHMKRYHQNESHLIVPQSHSDSREQRVTPRRPSSAPDPRGQGESLDPRQEPQPSRESTGPGKGKEVHSITVQERGEGEVAKTVLEDQGWLTLQTQLDIAEKEAGGNACGSRPKRKRQRNRWLTSDFEWEGEKDS